MRLGNMLLNLIVFVYKFCRIIWILKKPIAILLGIIGLIILIVHLV